MWTDVSASAKGCGRTPSRALALTITLALLLLGAASASAATTTLAAPPSSAATAPAGSPPTSTGGGLTPAPTSRGTTYGIGDAMGTYARCAPGIPSCCDPVAGSCALGGTDGFFDASAFERLTAPASAHRVTEVRLFVAYDALQEWNGSTGAPACAYSRALTQPWTDGAAREHDAGQSWDDLLAGLIEAHAEDLTPVVAITGYGSPHAIPEWDAPAPDPSTIAGWWEYHCGVQGILDATAKLPGWEQPHIWEAFNEPDGFRIFQNLDGGQTTSCAPRPNPQPDGPAKAACLYADATEEIHQFAGHSADTVIAGTFKQPSLGYLHAYAAALEREAPDAAYPTIWSVHDYVDVTRSYAGPVPTEIAPFDRALAVDTGGRAQQLWITEAGTLLTSRRPGGSCPASGPDAADTLGACLTGQVDHQENSDLTFFALPGDAGPAVPVTHLFWYQWQSAPNWDSGLVDVEGTPRLAWCRFYGSGSCLGNPSAD